jgi:hypothetical protein
MLTNLSPILPGGNVVINWPVPAAAAFCVVQTVAAGAPFIFNGTLSTTNLVGNNQIALFGINRIVSFTSADDNSLAVITIVGYLNGFLQSETLNGPNVNTVVSTKQYDVLTSITASIGVTNTSVGTSLLGSTDWIKSNILNNTYAITVQGTVVATAIKYSFEVTNDEVLTIAPASITTTTPIAALTAAITTQSGTYSNPTLYYRISILDTGVTNATGTLNATFIQQGSGR